MKTRKPHAFTLVELLVVIAIIAILASLGTYGAMAARNAALRFQITSQLYNVSLALENYKSKVGEYPPDFTDSGAVERHLQKRWPRYRPGIQSGSTKSSAVLRFFDDIKNLYPAWNFDDNDGGVRPNPAVALAFWLGGIPNADGTRLSGFSQDPTNPFNTTFDREEPIFEVSEEAKNLLKDDNDYPMVAVRDLPIVYFRGTSGSSDALRKTAYTLPTTNNHRRPKAAHIAFGGEDYGVAVPYAERGSDVDSNDNHFVDDGYCYITEDTTTPTDHSKLDIQWYNSTTFQLIHPGLDGYFSGNSRKDGGSVNDRKDGSDQDFLAEMTSQHGVTPLDLDNIVNYAEGGTVDSLLK